MRTTERGLLALARHEGVVPAPYLDVKGVWTFGIGHTAEAGAPDPAKMPRGMPADLDAGIAEALRLFHGGPFFWRLPRQATGAAQPPRQGADPAFGLP
jgi:hypothetical protein